MVAIFLSVLFTGPTMLMAASTPSLGQAASFGILSSTYTNTVSGTTITGDLGYTTGPAVAPTVNGTTFITPTQAGIDQGVALAALNIQPATYSFPVGAVDLSTDINNPNGAGVFIPGVYVIDGAASIGTGGITLNGSGTYIFRMTGALDTIAGSVVTLANGASPCDIFWTPGGATTLGANSTFAGTDIDASGITIGSTVNWTGRALAFGGTVSTATDTITISPCSAGTTPIISLTKTASLTSITQGVASTITYTYTVTNTGTGVLTNLNVTDNQLGAISLSSTTLAAGASITGTRSTTLTPANTSSIVNTAVATGTPPTGPNVAANAEATVTVTTPTATTTPPAAAATTTTAAAPTTTTVTTETTTTETTTAETTTTTAAPATTTITGGQIPKTSTPWYNVLIAGAALTLIGAVGWLITRKKIHV